MIVLTGMFTNKPVTRPGAYVFITIVARRCGKMALNTMEPRNPINAHFKKSIFGKRTYKKDIT